MRICDRSADVCSAVLGRVASHTSRHGTTAALLQIELDNLKAINDRHGRLDGDAALIHAAKILSGLICSTDIIARVGGNEFSIILDHPDHTTAMETAERLIRCITAEPEQGERTLGEERDSKNKNRV